MRVSVIILTWNQREITTGCLSSLLSSREREDETAFDLLVWDNGSTDGTAEEVTDAFPGVLVHRHPENLGVASGRNRAALLAIETFDPTHLLFLDNDTIVEPGFIGELLKPFARDPRIGQTQAKLRFLHDRNRLNDGGGAQISFLLWRTSPVGYGELDRGQHDLERECIACGGAMMVRTDVFLDLGGFDAQFDPFGPEDLDFSLRLRRAGYRALYVPAAVAYHAVSHTFGEGYTEPYARHKVRHWLAFMSRHASLSEKAGFCCFGLPYLTVRVVLREVLRGNLKSIVGLFRGVFDHFRPGGTSV